MQRDGSAPFSGNAADAVHGQVVDAVAPMAGAAIVAGASLLGAATGAYIVSKYREAYQTERIAPEVYVKDIDLETPPATLPANPALFVRR